MFAGLMLRWMICFSACGLQRAGDLGADLKRVPPVEHADGADPFDHLHEALALDVFHGDPHHVAHLARAVELDEVGMVQADHGLDGANEALDLVVDPGVFLAEHFHGHGLAVAGILALEDDTRLTPRDDGTDLVMGQRLADQPGQLVGGLRSHLGCGPAADERALLVDALDLEPQDGAANLDRVAIAQRVLIDLLAVDDRARNAAVVGEHELVTDDLGLAMHPRDRRVGQLRIRVLPTADQDGLASLDRIRLALVGAFDDDELADHGGSPGNEG